MGCAIHYVITDGTRYIGYDVNTKENVIVGSYKKAMKLKFTQMNTIYNRLADSLLNDGDWNIVSTIEIKHDLSDATIDIDVDEIMDSLEMDFDLLVKRKKYLELELLWTIVNKKDTIFKYIFWERLDSLPIPECCFHFVWCQIA